MLSNDAAAGVLGVVLVAGLIVGAYGFEVQTRGSVSVERFSDLAPPVRMSIQWTFQEPQTGPLPDEVMEDDEPMRYQLTARFEGLRENPPHTVWQVIGDADGDGWRPLGALVPAANAMLLDATFEEDLRHLDRIGVQLESTDDVRSFGGFVYSLDGLAGEGARNSASGEAVASWVGYHLGHLYIAERSDGFSGKGTLVPKRVLGPSAYCVWATGPGDVVLATQSRVDDAGSGWYNWEASFTVEGDPHRFEHLAMYIAPNCDTPEPSGLRFAEMVLPWAR